MATQSKISSQYSDALAALWQKLAASLADYDFTEQAKRREYESGLHNSGLDRAQSIRNKNISMADRGLTQSGISLQGDVDLNTAYDTKNAGLAGSFNAELSSLARKRLADESAYNLQKAQYERQTAAESAINTSLGGGGSRSIGGSSRPVAPPILPTPTPAAFDWKQLRPQVGKITPIVVPKKTPIGGIRPSSGSW